MKKIYLTDNEDEINKRTANRAKKIPDDLEDKWEHLKPRYKIDKESGERILEINGLEIMSEFEKPYMESLSKIVTKNGGNILNVGYGLGIIDELIEQQRNKNNLKEHHIIEFNKPIFNEAKKWKAQKSQSEQIKLYLGKWEEVIKRINIQFDGIIYDAFPLKKELLCRDFIPFLKAVVENKLIKENKGVITFYFDSSDGFGEDFKVWAGNLGIQKMDYKKIPIKLPERGTETWFESWFLAPTLSGISYK